MNNWSKYEKYDKVGIKIDDFLNTLPCKKVFIPTYKKWFEILKKDGNYASIDFNGKQITYNIIGLEVI